MSRRITRLARAGCSRIPASARRSVAAASDRFPRPAHSSHPIAIIPNSLAGLARPYSSRLLLRLARHGGGRAGHLANTRGLVKNERAPFRGSLRLRILHAYARNAQPPAENPAGVNADQAMRVGTARSIAHQAAGFGSFTPGMIAGTLWNVASVTSCTRRSKNVPGLTKRASTVPPGAERGGLC